MAFSRWRDKNVIDWSQDEMKRAMQCLYDLVPYLKKCECKRKDRRKFR